MTLHEKSAKGILHMNDLVLTVSDSIKDYLPCDIRFLKNKKKAQFGQSFLIKSLEKNFGG